MSDPICALLTVWWSLRSMLKGSYPSSGHNYYEVHDCSEVQLLKCRRCGVYSPAYYGQGEKQ